MKTAKKAQKRNALPENGSSMKGKRESEAVIDRRT